MISSFPPSSSLHPERVANVDEILGEQFLADTVPSEEDLMVSVIQLYLRTQHFELTTPYHTGSHTEDRHQEGVHSSVRGLSSEEQGLSGECGAHFL